MESGGVLVAEMPGGKRTDRISKRDLQVLELVARYGVIPREVVALWAETRRAVTLARERRLREAGLVKVLAGVGDSGRLVLCTREGLRAVCRNELPVPRFSAGRVAHAAAAARVGVELERRGQRVLTEPEIFARENAEGRRVLSAEHGSHHHRPDLVLLGETPETSDAIEVELTPKGATRLDGLLRDWRLAVAARQFGRVHYLCSPRVLRHVQAAVERTRTDAFIAVEPLQDRASLHDLAGGDVPRSWGWRS